MFFATDANTLAHGIQLAVAPVFLLTAVSGMIGSVAKRLARVIDRARQLEDRLEEAAPLAPAPVILAELKQLHKRSHLINICIGLLTLCGLQIGLTILFLFLGQTTAIGVLKAVTILFLSGVASFLLALLCFLAETMIATRIHKFGYSERQNQERAQ